MLSKSRVVFVLGNTTWSFRLILRCVVKIRALTTFKFYKFTFAGHRDFLLRFCKLQWYLNGENFTS